MCMRGSLPSKHIKRVNMLLSIYSVVYFRYVLIIIIIYQYVGGV